jgi:hypothetical protein
MLKNIFFNINYDTLIFLLLLNPSPVKMKYLNAMKNNKVLLGSLLLTGAMLFSASIYFNNKAYYTPRVGDKSESQEEERDASGAAEWLFNIRKNPVTGTIDPRDVLKAREEVAQMLKNRSASSALGLDWKELGPDNVGGRTRAILIDKSNPTKIFAGNPGGGLFVSTNAGTTWQNVAGFDQKENLAISCITQAANGDIYVGTGESMMENIGGGFFGSFGGEFLGGGIYKSTDDGATFNLLPSTIPTTANQPTATATTAFIGVNNLAADPFDANKIYAATFYGLQVTTDGGATWSHPINTTRATDIEVASDGTVMVAVASTLYRSTDGINFTAINTAGSTSGFPSSSVLRIELAISPSDPNYMYASVANTGTSAATTGHLLGVYQSIDKGLTWKNIGNGGSSQFDPLGNQGWYANTLAVYPADKTQIIIGGLDNWVWKQTSPSVVGVGQWFQGTFWDFSPISSHYVHADIHTIKFHPTNPNVIYIGCDGGVFRSTNGGMDFSAMNNKYNVTQLYSIAFESDANKGVMGGAQDNGTNYISGHGNSVQAAKEVNGGDGAQCEISYLNPNVSFSTVYYGSLKRHSSKGGVGNSMYSKNLVKRVGTNPASSVASFVTPIALYETKNSTNSPDSVTFTNGLITQIGVTGNGILTHYTGFLNLPQQSATLIQDSVVIKIGTVMAKANPSGVFIGNVNPSGVNTVSPSGYYDITFSSPPTNGAVMNLTFKVQYAAGSNLVIERSSYAYPLVYTTPTAILPGQTVKIHDPFQAKLAVGLNGFVYMTKEALDFSGTPLWMKLGAINGQTGQLAWSADGNVLYVGTENGSLYRFSNLAAIIDSTNGDIGGTFPWVVTAGVPLSNPPPLNPGCVVVKDLLQSFGGGFITGISVDPNDANNVAVSVGGYGNSTHVYYSTNALAPGTTPTFLSKQGSGLPAMPVYSVMIEQLDPKRVLVGTDHGVFSTDDITANPVIWSPDNGVAGMLPNVPVYKLRQQRLPETAVYNAYVIYAATHGRGAWKSDKYFVTPTVGINEPYKPKETSLESGLSIYPNPMSEQGTVAFNLNSNAEIVVSIFSLQGKLVKSIKVGKLNAGAQKIQINTDELSKGTYLLSVDGDNTCHATSRFVVIK